MTKETIKYPHYCTGCGLTYIHGHACSSPPKTLAILSSPPFVSPPFAKGVTPPTGAGKFARVEELEDPEWGTMYAVHLGPEDAETVIPLGEDAERKDADDLCHDINRSHEKAVQEAVKAEKERCALIAEEMLAHTHGWGFINDNCPKCKVVPAIRKQGG